MARTYQRGLQPERTALAWRRTAIAWWAVTALALNRAAERHEVPLGVVAGVLVLGSATVTLLSSGRHRMLAGQGPRLDHRRVRLVAVLAVAACVAALLLVL